MGEPGRIEAFLGWWRDLPTGWRVNAGLYVLAGLSLVALLTQMVVGGDSGPRRVEVAAGRREPARSTTTRVAPSTSEPPSTVAAVTTTPPPTTGRSSPAPTSAARGGGGASKGGGGGGGGAPPVSFEPPPPTSFECGRNSTDDRCGPLRWDPEPNNQPVRITIDSPSTAKVGEQVTFHLTATDPDHLVTGHCTRFDFGDGQHVNAPCSPPPCENARGVWDTWAAQSNTWTDDIAHVYDAPGTYTVKATFRTDRDRCPDPYGSVGTESRVITITE